MGMLSVSAAAPNYTHINTDNKGVKTDNVTVYAYNRSGDNQADAQAILDGVTSGAKDLSPTDANVQNGTLTSAGYIFDGTKYASSGGAVLNTQITKVQQTDWSDPNKSKYWYFPSLLIKDKDGDLSTTQDQTYPHIEDNQSSYFVGFSEGNPITKQYGYSNGKAYYYDAAGGEKKDIAGLEAGKPYAYEDVIYNLSSPKRLTDIVVGRQYSDDRLATSNYKVYTSINGTDYTEVYNYDIANFDGNPLFEIIHFNNPQKAQYVKLEILDPVNNSYVGAGNYYAQTRISAFKVFGYEGEDSSEAYINDYKGVGTKVYSYAQVNAATDGTNYYNAKAEYILKDAKVINIGNLADIISDAYKYDENSKDYTKMFAFNTGLKSKVNDKKDMCENAAEALSDADNSNGWIFAEGDANKKVIKQYGYSNGQAYYYDDSTGVKKAAPEEMGSNPYRYEDLIYKFTSGTGITAVALASQSQDSNMLATSNYKVLVGDDYKDLQEVYNFDSVNYNFGTHNRTQLICFDEAIYAKYVVIRILDPVSKSHIGSTGDYLVATRLPLARVYGYAPNVNIKDNATSADGRTQLPVGTINETDFYSLSAKTGKENLHLVQYNSAGLPVSEGVQFTDTAKGQISDGPANGDALIKGDWTADDAGTQWHTDIYYDFGAVCDVKEVVVAQHDNWLRIDRYAIYASDNLYDLYSDENIVGYELNGNNVSGGLSYQQNFIIKEPIAARYVGMRIWRPQPGTHTSGMYIRLYEFNVYGCTKEQAKAIMTVSDSDLPAGTSSIITSDPTVRYKESTNGGEFVETNSVTANNTLYDNNTTTAYTTDSYFADESGVYIDGTAAAKTKQRVVDIEYDLGKSKDFNTIYVASKIGAEALGRYVVYASNDKDTLYSDSNVVADYNNSEGYINCPYNKSRQMFSLNTSVNARYVALRIIDPKTGYKTTPANYSATIQEFNLYKSDFSISTGTASANNTSAYETDAQIGSSLIRGKNSTGYRFDGTDKVDFTVGGSGHYNEDKSDSLGSYAVTAGDHVRQDVNWTGADYNNNNESLIDDESKLWQQVDYTLDGEANISKIGVFGHGSKELNFSHIKLIFSDTKEGLYNLEAAGTTVYDVRNDSGLTYLIVNPNSEITAKYFAVRIICGITQLAIDHNWPGAGNCHGRIRHISLLGEYTNPQSTLPTVTVDDEATGTVAKAIANTDINGNYPADNIATYTAVANEGYQFVKWADADGKYISDTAAYKYTTSSPATIKAVFASATDGTKVIKLADAKTGETVDVLTAATQEDLDNAVKAAAPKKFGYTVNGSNNDFAAVANGSTVAPKYERITGNPNYQYRITAKDVGDETGTTLDVAFDTRVIIESESDAENIYWTNTDDSVIGVGKTVDFYACANDTVTAKEGTATADAVTMFAATNTTGVFNGNSMTVFGKFDGKTAPAKFGVAFTSKNKYDVESDWDALILAGNAQVVEFQNSSNAPKGYFMGTLQGITTSSQTTRYAVCFVEDADGNRTYSTAKSVTFISGS